MIKRRMLFVAKNLAGGGAEKVLLETAAMLRQRGHTVLVVVLSDEVTHSMPAGLKIVQLKAINAFTKSAHRLSVINRWQAALLQQEVDSFQADVVISCNAEYISRYLQHSNLYHWVHGVISGSKARVVADLKAIYHQAQLICVAKAIQDDVAALHIQPKKSALIYNPFDVDKIQRLATAYTPAIQAPFLLHVGSFDGRKRHDRLLQAYQLSGVNVPLVLMGQGELAAQIQTWIDELGLQERVRIHPFETNPYPYIQAASALLLSSDQEGLPTVLIEALICHTPIVSVDCPSGPSEILTGKLAPFLVDKEDVTALAQAIKTVLAQPPVMDDEYYQPFIHTYILPQFEALI